MPRPKKERLLTVLIRYQRENEWVLHCIFRRAHLHKLKHELELVGNGGLDIVQEAGGMSLVMVDRHSTCIHEPQFSG